MTAKVIELNVERRRKAVMLERLAQPEVDGSGWVVLLCALGIGVALVLGAVLS